jgi:hypothetical protein
VKTAHLHTHLPLECLWNDCHQYQWRVRLTNTRGPRYAPGNLTAAGRQTAAGAVLATHTQLTPGAAVAILLSLDAPSLTTGTGSALLLDGHDAGLVRATVVDAAGLTVDTSCVITFNVTSGPGRIIGVHNGNAASHEPQIASARMVYHGLARAVVKVRGSTPCLPCPR